MSARDDLAGPLSVLSSALTVAGEPLYPEDEAAALAEGEAFLATLTPPAAIAVAAPARAFGFENLSQLDDMGLQTLIRHVPFEVLALALTVGPDALARRFQRNLSKRRAALLAEDFTRLRGNAPPQAIDEARAQVVRIAVGLALAGRIVICEGEYVEVGDDLDG